MPRLLNTGFEFIGGLFFDGGRLGQRLTHEVDIEIHEQRLEMSRFIIELYRKGLIGTSFPEEDNMILQEDTFDWEHNRAELPEETGIEISSEKA